MCKAINIDQESQDILRKTKMITGDNQPFIVRKALKEYCGRIITYHNKKHKFPSKPKTTG